MVVRHRAFAVGTSPSLQALVRRLWLEPGDGDVVVTFDSQAPPEGFVLHSAFDVVPNTQHAKFLVPATPTKMAVGAVLAYNGLRSRRTMVRRVAVAATLTLRAQRLARFGRMVVWVRASVPEGEPVLLVDHLRDVLSEPSLQAAVGVHQLDPNSKPTLQLFDSRGRPRAFAKVGWTPPTARLVQNEARALADLATTGTAIPFPGLLAATTWKGMPVTVVEPLPRGARRVRDPLPPATPTLRQVAGPLRTVPLAKSSYWAGVRAAADQIRWHEFGEAPPRGFGDYLQQLEDVSDTGIQFGRWHGDWVPWNVARDGRHVYAFDWEHSTAEAPWGYDLAHWSFQQQLVSLKRNVRAAAEAADADTRRWPSAGVMIENSRLVVSLYLLEMALRTVRLRHDGGFWNQDLYPGLFEVMADRLPRLT